ncbi:uncharacterized membrane protein YhaH (DUF805 family) [Curtobacterium luteum]|uniref:Uncharacterized membrane protein YhaH (DUF805 family) n=1 Tax=Curtobacterium luteum TaxID=33881 RepID=A0A8H9GAK6_9MICO|nr:DUF6264 family protein [Curtobacterium luteum]MBM7804131.1 uncharacterized membrane protein YhaH (DUF805 family) [Curtobacterium luteum]NUU51016.1 hypothetical protein [Curtobacterium luteum]GGK97994.1 hypothetical protein GCM10009769_15140 [Curtobacterium luteum]
MSGDWSEAPVHDPGHGRADDGREARLGPATSAAAPAAGRVRGTPAPQYGEYAPEGWVNPVLAEQERVEREAESRALREQAARETAGTPARPGQTGSRPARAGGVTTAPSSRFGASPLDFGMTVGLLVLGLWSVLQSLSVGQVASAVRQTFEQRYTTFSDPSVLTGAAIVGAVASVVLFALTLWWSIRRLRARRWTFWVPLLGGVVSTAVSVTAFLVVVLQDPRLVDAVLRSSGGA